MRKLLFIISLLIMYNMSYSQEETSNTEDKTEEIIQQEESESTLDFMLSPTLGFNLQNNSFERDNEVLTAQWLGSLRSKLDIYGDIFNFNSSLTAQYGQIISKDKHPITTQDRLSVSLMPSMELFKSFQIRLFLDNVVQTSMDYNENYGNPTTFLDPAYMYHTLFIGQDYKWSNESIIDLGDITSARATEMLLPLWLRLWGTLGTAEFNFGVIKK